jgi:transcriptional regulator with XRE-family HTH domain
MTTGIEVFGSRLKEKRSNANLSQDGLAVLVGNRLGEQFHQTNISGYERGEKLPSIQVFRLLVELLSTNADYMLGMC